MFLEVFGAVCTMVYCFGASLTRHHAERERDDVVYWKTNRKIMNDLQSLAPRTGHIWTDKLPLRTVECSESSTHLMAETLTKTEFDSVRTPRNNIRKNTISDGPGW